MFGENFRKIRKSYGISQVELAERLGVTKQAVSNWENNNIKPSVEMLIRISRFFSVSCDYLLGLDENSFIETHGLTEEEISHIRNQVEDLRKTKAE